MHAAADTNPAPRLQEGRLYSVSLTVLNFDALQLDSLVYENIGSTGGPLPSFNLGVQVDSANSSVGCVA